MPGAEKPLATAQPFSETSLAIAKLFLDCRADGMLDKLLFFKASLFVVLYWAPRAIQVGAWSLALW
jgi:hypothetical protein